MKPRRTTDREKAEYIHMELCPGGLHLPKRMTVDQSLSIKRIFDEVRKDVMPIKLRNKINKAIKCNLCKDTGILPYSEWKKSRIPLECGCAAL